MTTKTAKKLLILMMLLASVGALNACALCHGLDSHHAQEIRDKYWDHSNMQW